MKRRLLLSLEILAVAGLLATAPPAPAQVTVNPQALDQAEGKPAESHHHRRAHTVRHHHPVHTRKSPQPAAAPEQAKPEQAKPEQAKPEQAKTEKPTAPVAPMPTIPAAPPAAPGGIGQTGTAPAPGPKSALTVPPQPPGAPHIAPVAIPAPVHPEPPPPPVPVVAGATGAVTPLPDGVRLTFGTGSADLNRATDDALRAIAQAGAKNPAVTYTVKAYAPGPADDPSTARRLSLSRALAARSVLITEGIPSTRIYVRALGSDVGNGPADRVDVAENGPPAASSTPAEPAATPAQTGKATP